MKLTPGLFALIEQICKIGSSSQKRRVQWGSKILTNPDFKWSKTGQFANYPDLFWYLKSGSPTSFNQY